MTISRSMSAKGSVSNYVASGIALNEIKKVFITHLHVDHYNALPYIWMFGTWAGGWHERPACLGSVRPH